ncbi:MAG: transcriptional repressor [Treponema sp. GWB1_62_6]|nr:MAG: transcriptional repressor [Treponema sp. GWA1_62_8]OHE66416.1 MAG: transcriptional repressor [Treponema sp. GWC1_61_84]OHE66849.1 MAG: transcriptional repressor [Treponema sp. GWB1_62_6]OHE74276.1 MAG: transcriptional repressor [Treponema sp. RIFOXYC1_FULL_61_9]HCM27829.1 transcriptional repressor [Treponema sp.]
MDTTVEAKRYKRSRQRERILDTLRRTDSHPTAAWIYDELKRDFPDLSLGTVYRNLNILHDQGLVRVLQSGSTFDRFDADTSVHYHFVCQACGKVEDVAFPLPHDLDERASAMLGRVVTGHRLDFFGLCNPCSSAESADPVETGKL